MAWHVTASPLEPVPHVQAASQARHTESPPRVSIIVVNYRQWDETHQLLRQVLNTAALRSGAAEVVVVDNHSPNHPLARKMRRLPGVSLRRWARNHGFARAVNEGCRLSRGDWFLLLNPDITLSDGFLDGVLKLIDELGDNSRVGIVGFQLRNSDGSRQFSSGPFPTLWSTLLRLVRPRRSRKYTAPRSFERCEVPWATGCCLLVRRACVEDLGGLDENFFLYYEDVDLCRRARQRGWTVWYEPNLAVVHHHPLHARPMPAALRLVTRHSLLSYAAKHWPAWHFRLLARIVRLESWTRRLVAWWRGDPQQAHAYRELALVTRNLVAGAHEIARRRLHQAVQRIDVRVGI